MMIYWPLRRKLDTLIWEYLDGESTPDRLSLLERILLRKRSARRTFVEYSRLHMMLCEFFRTESGSPFRSATDYATEEMAERRQRPRRKRRGKSGAA